MSSSLNDAERRALRMKSRMATLDALRSLGGEGRRDTIRELALADGGFSSRELSAPPPERAAAKYARLVDHELSWALTNLKRDGLVANPKWGTWRLTDTALCTVEQAADAPVAPERLAELRAMPYHAYLRTPEWRRTRAGALLRADNACSLDVTHTHGLEVHHRTYERRGEELVTDLVVLCHSCHQLHHAEYGLPRREGPAASRRVARDDSMARSAKRLSEQPKRSLLRRLLTR